MTIRAHRKHQFSHRGFSLPEAMLAMVILAMAAAGVLLPFASGASVQAEGMHQSLGAGLANDLLERIVRTPFSQIVAAPPNGWNGYAEDQGEIKDASGHILVDPIYANYGRDVSCSYVYVPQQSRTVAANFILASVRVYYQGGKIMTVHRLISQ